jgi:hypothetical protein
VSILIDDPTTWPTLTAGSHKDAADGLCLVELTAFLAGEKHSDQPECVCPVIGAFARSWHDHNPALSDSLKAELGPLMIGTRSTPEIQDRRAIMVADWSVRTVLPAWLDLVPSLAEHAAELRGLPELTTVESLNARPWDAARVAARAAQVRTSCAASARWRHEPVQAMRRVRPRP